MLHSASELAMVGFEQRDLVLDFGAQIVSALFVPIRQRRFALGIELIWHSVALGLRPDQKRRRLEFVRLWNERKRNCYRLERNNRT